jgi:hypothetical protein
LVRSARSDGFGWKRDQYPRTGQGNYDYDCDWDSHWSTAETMGIRKTWAWCRRKGSRPISLAAWQSIQSQSQSQSIRTRTSHVVSSQRGFFRSSQPQREGHRVWQALPSRRKQGRQRGSIRQSSRDGECRLAHGLAGTSGKSWERRKDIGIACIRSWTGFG